MSDKPYTMETFDADSQMHARCPPADWDVDKLRATVEALEAARADNERLRALAYFGEHHFPDLTWKARCDELRDDNAALKAEVERLRAELASLKARRFPVLDAGFSVPWSVVAPFETRAQKNHGGQTLERLADRGGLSARELYCVMHGISWEACPVTAVEAHQWALELAAPKGGG